MFKRIINLPTTSKFTSICQQLYHPRSSTILFTWSHCYSTTRNHIDTTQVPGLLFDIDGVLIRGNQVLPEAKEAFKLLKNHPT